MGAIVITRWVLAAVHAVPPLQRLLDKWSRRRAIARRERRIRLAAQRQR